MLYLAPRKRGGFTLVELLVAIGITTVISVTVFVVLDPPQLMKQSRDGNRLADSNTIASAIGTYQADICPANLGSYLGAYISIPDTDPNCANLGLPALPDGMSYYCASSTNFRKINGTGWIPIDFTRISFGTPFSQLPVDPVNTTSSGYYYTFHPGANGNEWELTSVLESNKYSPRMSSDNGSSTGAFETGPNLTLAPGVLLSRCVTPTSTPPAGGGSTTTLASITQTSDADSNNGFALSGYSNSQTQISGSGSSASVILAQNSSRPSAPSCSGTDHGGSNWTVTDNDTYDLNAAAGTIEIAGDHCNVGVFSIPAGRTVYVKTYNGSAYGQLKVTATSISIAGTLNGDARGYAGGSFGSEDGVSGTNTGSYGSAGGAGGYGAYAGGTSVGSTRGTSSGTDIDMGGGGASGGHGGYGSYGYSSNGADGGRGGSSVYLYSSASTTVSGIISMNGGDGGYGGGGDIGDCSYGSGDGGGGGSGASGGGILVNGATVVINGTVRANGGAGGGGGSGGENYENCDPGRIGEDGSTGGGGRVKVFATSLNTTGSTMTATGYTSGSVYTASGGAYYSSGTYTSGPVDGGASIVSWGDLSWTHSGGQTITIKARSAATSNMSGATAWGSCSNISNGAALSTGNCVTNGHRYLQYQASLGTAATSTTPSLDDVTVEYSY